MLSRPTPRPIVWLIVAGLALALLVHAVPSPAQAQGGPPSAGGAPRITVARGAGTVSATVSPTANAPGYELEVASSPFRITTTRRARTVLTTADGALRYRSAGSWHHATVINSVSWRTDELHVNAASTQPGHTIEARIGLTADRYTMSWSVVGSDSVQIDQVGMVYDLASAGHWYGHGEIWGQPYPLETGRIRNSEFSPASYEMLEPFWYTSSAAGLWVDTGKVMDVALNDEGDGRGRFTIADGGAYQATVFVESTPAEVYRDWIGVVGKPAKSDATYEQFAKPLWNSWAQLYNKVDQESLLAYAEGLHRHRLGGHTIQVDNELQLHHGTLTLEKNPFPNPRAMSDRIHELGFDFGIWTTLWAKVKSAKYKYAAEQGYLLADGQDPSKPCTVQWWTGKAGIIDLGNPKARAWYADSLRQLMKDLRIDGLKFDTAFFNDACAPAAGYEPRDYQRLGAELADEFDLQGAGIRVHWAGPQRHGFVTRTHDVGTDWAGMQSSFRQALAVSMVGYPFVETDMIGGSLMKPPPTKEVLVRWAQAAALTPLMYASTSPVGVRDITTGKWVAYDKETVALYREALATHERLAPYLWRQVQNAVATGDPIVRPPFFDFPDDQRMYTVDDQWMVGPAVLAAPMLRAGNHRDIHLPAGRWFDVNHGTMIDGPTTLAGYPAPLGVTPAFVRAGAAGANEAKAALRRTDTPPAGLRFVPPAASTGDGQPVEVTTTVSNWANRPINTVRLELAVPQGWSVEPTSPTKFDRVRRGKPVSTTWRVTPAPGARWASHPIFGSLTYRAAQRSHTTTDTAPVTVEPVPNPDGVPPPYRVHSTTRPEERPEYAHSGGQFAIWAGGRDLSGGVDEKALIYRDEAFGPTGTVVTRLASQQGGSPIAKAGLTVANDLAAPEKGGYAVLVMTASNGVEFMWDGNGDGKLDGWAGDAASFHPAWLKLTRNGTTYIAYTSRDGKKWQRVGTATVPSASGIGHAGVVASAVNANHPGAVTRAVFDEFSIGP